MKLSQLDQRYDGRRVLVVAGGPTIDGCRVADFEDMPAIGVNTAFRVWPVELSVVVKDVIHDEVRPIVPAEQRVVASNCGLQAGEDPYIYEPRENMNVLAGDADPKGLVGGTCGGTGTAIHLAYRCGAKAIFVIGADLGLRGERYHALGYWRDTNRFRGMGWRKDIPTTETVFARQAVELARITTQLASVGVCVYFVSPEHWRAHAGDGAGTGV